MNLCCLRVKISKKMSQPCAANKCIRESRGLCDCCRQQLCIQHLSEHNAALINQLNPLTDEFNALSDRLNTLSIQNITGKSRRKLEQWRDRSHQQIDRLFKQKCEEIDRIVNDKIQKQREDANRLQNKLAEVIREQEATRQRIDSLTSAIHDLKEQMTELENTSFRVTTQRLIIDDTLISIEAITEHELNLSNLPHPCKTIKRPAGSQAVICSSDNYLLIHQKPNLCLIDVEMSIVEEATWDHESIWDMCWCSTLDRFIVNEGSNIFLVDESTMSIEKIKTIEEKRWLSCTTSENHLFLSTNTYGSIVKKYDLLPSIKLVIEWKSPFTCTDNEWISSIRYNNEKLGLLIRNNPEKSLRMELRSADTFDRIWLLKFDIVCEQTTFFRCCSLTYNEWLVADYQSKRLLQVTKDGKLKAVVPYKNIPYYSILFRNMLAISTDTLINIHKL